MKSGIWWPSVELSDAVTKVRPWFCSVSHLCQVVGETIHATRCIVFVQGPRRCITVACEHVYATRPCGSDLIQFFLAKRLGQCQAACCMRHHANNLLWLERVLRMKRLGYSLTAIKEDRARF